MGKFLVKRILSLIPTVFISMAIIFFLMQALPVDPIHLMYDTEDMTDAQVQELEEKHGFDDPAIVQYLRYMKNVFKGDWGNSLFSKEPVFQAIADRMEPTLLITFFSTLLTMVVAIPAGVFAATHRNSPLDYTISASSILFDSIPTFWLGLMLLYIFSFKMDIFPLDGYKLIEHYGWGEALKSLVLPCFALGMGHVAGLARQTRSQMLNVLSADYIRTARAKGLSERMVNYKHALKNTMSLVVTIVGGSIGAMLGGSTVIENVFNIQGVGKLAYTSLMRSDYYQEQGIIMFITLIYAGMNILLDIVYKKLDPRIEL